MRYVVVECYPAMRGASFGRFSTAYAGCWITDQTAGDDAAAIAYARERIATIDWSIAEVISVTVPVDVEHEHYRQATIDGFACDVRRVETRWLPGHEGPKEHAAELLDRAFRSVATTGAWTRRGLEGEQAIANLDGDEVAPLWCSERSALAFADEWPDCRLVYASAPELKHELLAELHGRKRQVMIDVGDNAMVTCHPFALRDALLVG
ncbi:MAG TPA: hypothetical protein VH143_10440 [Kofleriaceae bacterium]|jgi:hypothetical protein|nr:hypothetical protein [Kofleriaceae bacterium]